MERWARNAGLACPVECRAAATDARVEAVREAAAKQDFIIMNTETGGLRRYVFGSLAADVARGCRKPMMLVYNKP
jgi:nucleotide-binding universal stress UspA family protein